MLLATDEEAGAAGKQQKHRAAVRLLLEKTEEGRWHVLLRDQLVRVAAQAGRTRAKPLDAHVQWVEAVIGKANSECLRASIPMLRDQSVSQSSCDVGKAQSRGAVALRKSMWAVGM